MGILQRLECNVKWKLIGKEAYKIRPKTVELPFENLKHNMKLTEFTTTGLKRTNTEFKLYTIGNNLKRIYNAINKQKQEINT